MLVRLQREICFARYVLSSGRSTSYNYSFPFQGRVSAIRAYYNLSFYNK